MVLDQDRLSRVKDLLHDHPEGLTISEISAKSGINRNSLAKYLNVLTISGQVEMQSYGASRVYYLSQRVPISAMLSFTSDFIIVLNGSGQILQVNEAILDFFREKRENLVGKSLDDVTLDFLRNLPLTHIMERKDSYPSESEVVTQWDGNELFFKIKVVPSVFDDGSQGITLIIEDITRQKIYERQLAIDEARFRAIIEDQTELIARFRYSGELTFTNESFRSYFGESIEKPGIPVDFFSTIHPDDRKYVKGKIHGLSPENRVCSPKFRIHTSQGTRWIQWTIRAITDEFGGIVEYQGVGRDITDRREAEKRISRYIAELKFLSRSVMTFVKTSDEVELYRMIASNLKEIYPEAIAALVLSYSNDTGNMRIEAISGDNVKNFLDARIGSNLCGRFFAPGKGAVMTLREDRNMYLEDGFGGDFLSRIGGIGTRDFCREIDIELGIGYGYMVGFITEEELFGCAVIFLPPGQNVKDPILISTYLNQASIVLRRIKAERGMKKSEEQFRNICELSPFPISIISSTGKYLYVNNNFTSTFGWDLNDIGTGRDWFRLAFPDEEYRMDALTVWKTDLKHSEIGAVRPRTFTVNCKDGSQKEILFRPVTMEDNTQFVVYEDITVKTDSEKMKNLLASIVQSTDDAIIGKTPEGRILSWNAGAEKMSGYRAEEMIGADIRLLVPHNLLEELEDLHVRVRNGESISHHETQRIRKDGELIDVSVTMSPILDQKKHIIGISSIVQNITTLKAERRLTEVEEQYRSLVDNINVGIYRSTGDPKGRFVWGNTSLLQILGYSSFEKLKSVAISDMFVDSGGRKELLNELSRIGFVRNREIQLKKSNGSIIWVLVTALANFSPENKILYINGIVEDISDRKILEQQLVSLKESLDSYQGSEALTNLMCRNALSGAGDSITLLDGSGNIILANQSFRELCSHPDSQGETAKVNIIKYVADESRKDLMKSIAAAMKSGTAMIRYSLVSTGGRVQVDARMERIDYPGGDFLIAVHRPVDHKESAIKHRVFK